MKSASLLLPAVLYLFLPTVCAAATETSESVATNSRGLTPIDWAIVAVYAASTIGLGLYYSRKQESTEEYFVGSGHMNPLLIGVSLFATLLSTISYLSFPGEALGKGPIYLTQLIAFPFIFYVVGYVLLPVYMRQRVTSAYELLEENLGLSVRLLGAGLFVILRLVWMSLLVYLTADAIRVMLGIGPEWIPLIVLVTGFVAVIYTSLGGLQAVVITDAMQCTLLYGGALLVLGTVTWNYGGFGWFPTGWHANWDTQPIIPADPSTRVSMLGSILSVTFWYIATSGGDQTSVQRFMATTDAKAARRAFATQLTVAVIVLVTLGLVGVALLGYFEANPDQLPAGMTLKENADDIFPRYIAYHLPVGVSGLVVAAMFAAAMSSIDSGVNSITAVVMTDLLDRFGRKPDTEKKHVLWARCLAFGIGAAVVIGSSFMDRIPGNITAITNKTANLLTTPIFCLFFFALFVPFAKPAGVWVGAICGTTTAVLIAFSGPIFGVHPETGLDPISFQWIAPGAVLVNVTTGSIVSLLLSSRSNDEPTV
ncbi:Sodium/glucose cotransporter [Maioricimonas rarisocia]|uniref:Sodium/glucose cotransporter n=1 Tax=Maioricimonas rarisocia TaxID=2528026 RepID=A0A517ZG97_9PLAN|nr:sodium-coupled permease [Maioricimonas rarisocia]QDU41484.1 Sodium/glucose cotransporter [Maioricimonas rarisocia]